MSDPDERFKAIVQKLKEHQHKITPQRLAIIQILTQSREHPGVEDIYQQLRHDFPTMSLATVYRNILLIKSMGEVLELGFPEWVNRYDGVKPYPHPHVICVRCRKIVDPDLESLDHMTREAAVETEFKILSHRLDFFGICKDCLAKQE